MLPNYKMQTISASAQVGTTDVKVMAILVTAAAAVASVALANQTTAGGTDVITVGAPVGGSSFVDLTAVGGLMLDTGAYATLVGAGGIAYIWFED